MRTSRISRLARLAQRQAQSANSGAAGSTIKVFDVTGASLSARIAGYAALTAAGGTHGRGGFGAQPKIVCGPLLRARLS